MYKENFRKKIHVKKLNVLEFILILLFSFIPLFYKSPITAMLISIVQTIVIIRKAKFSFFSIFVFLINFCLLQEFFAYSGFSVYGILGSGWIDIYFYELCSCSYMLNVIVFVIITMTNVIENEKSLYTFRFDFSKNTITIITVIALIITVLIFPTLPGNFSTTNRFSNGYLSFTGWSCIPFFFVAIGILSGKRKKFVYLSAIFIMGWYVLHGERIDAIGLIIFIMLWYFNIKKRDFRDYYKYAILLFCIIIALIIVGLYRSGYNITLKTVFNGIIIQATACDVTSVFNAAVDLELNGQAFKGTTYLSYLVNCVPLLNDSYSFQRLIMKVYPSAGGSLFFAEPIANYGYVFCFFITVLYFIAIRQVIKKHTIYRTLIYIELCLSIFRMAWYGLNYPMTTILYFVPFIIVLDKMLKRKV